MKRMLRGFFYPHGEGVYLHVYNHTVVMENNMLPLGEWEKTKFKIVVDRYLKKYNLQVISLTVMSNHFHILIYCPPEKFTPQEALDAYNSFHKQEDNPVKLGDHRAEALIETSNDISSFMREVQSEFSWLFNINRPYKRRGALWQDRFKCQLIQSDVYLWACVKYIEMNPVRARICENAGDYAHSSFGQWIQTGKHPYESNFMHHILEMMSSEKGMEELQELMEEELEAVKIKDQITLCVEHGNHDEAERLRCMIPEGFDDLEVLGFRGTNWIKGAVIGTEEYKNQKYHEWAKWQAMELENSA